MYWWNQKIIIQKESIQEENVKKYKHVGENAKILVAVP